MSNWINKTLDRYYDRNWKPKNHRLLLDSVYQQFKMHGQGLYYSCIESKNNNIVSKAISLLSGKYSHAFAILYSENMRDEFTEAEWNRLIYNWMIYYNMSREDAEYELKHCKILVLGSADNNGMNYPDFSTYQNRKQVIRQATVSNPFCYDTIKHWFVSKQVMASNYDYTGLAFWWLFKLFDDERSYYCSELVYEGFRKGLYYVSRPDPSPTDINKYAKERIAFTLGGSKA